jgi:hypothetical protein
MEQEKPGGIHAVRKLAEGGYGISSLQGLPGARTIPDIYCITNNSSPLPPS